jgi:hypothetical protein
MIAAAMTASIPCMKKKGMTGILAPIAVERAPELAETSGLENESSGLADLPGFFSWSEQHQTKCCSDSANLSDGQGSIGNSEEI